MACTGQGWASMGQPLPSPKAPPAHGMLQTTILLPSPSPQHQLPTANKGTSAAVHSYETSLRCCRAPQTLALAWLPWCRTIGERVVKQGHPHPSKGWVLS